MPDTTIPPATEEDLAIDLYYQHCMHSRPSTCGYWLTQDAAEGVREDNLALIRLAAHYKWLAEQAQAQLHSCPTCGANCKECECQEKLISEFRAHIARLENLGDALAFEVDEPDGGFRGFARRKILQDNWRQARKGIVEHE